VEMSLLARPKRCFAAYDDRSINSNNDSDNASHINSDN
jgi:hypothetical protein